MGTRGAALIAGAILIVGTLVAAAVYFSSEQKAMVVLTALAVVGTFLLVWITLLYVRTTRSIEWFTGAMQRHSDQMRQIAAHQADIKMVWWDPTAGDSKGKFPFDGKHGEENKLDVLYIGVPMEERVKQPTKWERFWSGP